MKAYYGSQISENMVVTPEGFLICKNAPIARTGAQEYLRSELGLDGSPNDIVNVYREESEVFDPATMASFEGKPVTYDHPPDGVDVQNIAAYDNGHIQNVRRGTGEESDLLIGDLFITNSRLIEAIQNGVREISCGYDVEYVMAQDGNIYQRSIRGNHVAVVPAGRAGHRVAIKDSAESKSTDKERGKKIMSKRNQPSLMARLFSRAVKDMEPEEVADAIEELASASADEEAAAPAPAEKPAATDKGCGANDDDPMQALLVAVNALLDKLNGKPTIEIDEEGAAQPAEKPAATDEGDPLQQLVEEIATAATADPSAQGAEETPADQEAAATIPADELPEEATDEEEPAPTTADEEGPVAPAASLPENPIPGADRIAARYALSAINAVKPIIAALPANQRKAASDRAAAEIRKMLGKGPRSKSNGYTGINATVRQAAKARSKDSRSKADNGELGRKIMAAHNPHYKKS